MSEVKWIKITTDIFDDEKMVLIEQLPEADSIIVIWFKLLCLNRKNKKNHVLKLTEDIAYTEEMLSVIIRKSISDVVHALDVLEKYGMVKRTSKGIFVFDESRRNRSSKDYQEWRKAVFERDDYKCRLCGRRGCELNAHHIKYWSKSPEYRFDVNNGITLCKSCHIDYHKKNGR